MEMPLFKRFNERPSRWNARWPTVHRMIYPAYPKRLCVCRGRNAIHFRARGCPGLTRPSRPLSEMAGRVVKEAKTPIFIGFYGEDPPRQHPSF
jgi:hypothetical protein